MAVDIADEEMAKNIPKPSSVIRPPLRPRDSDRNFPARLLSRRGNEIRRADKGSVHPLDASTGDASELAGDQLVFGRGHEGNLTLWGEAGHIGLRPRVG